MENMNDKNNIIEPIDSLAEESRFSAFICKKYPTSCEECPNGWHSICKVDHRKKGKSFLQVKRPCECPLITPIFYTDSAGYKYPVLDDVEWLSRNPIIVKGGVIISKDMCKIKFGDGISNYTSLPFIDTSMMYISKNKKTTEQNDDVLSIDNDDYITFNIKCKMKSRWVNQFCSFLKQMEKNGHKGHSEYVSFMSDGDGDFRPEFDISIDFTEEKPPKEKCEIISDVYDAG